MIETNLSDKSRDIVSDNISKLKEIFSNNNIDEFIII